MNVVKWRLVFISLLLALSGVMIAQVDRTDRTVDFRNELRTLWQKSTKDVAPNIIALPIIDQNLTKDIEVPFFTEEGQTSHSSIILGDNAEVYLLFSDFVLQGDEVLTVSSEQGLWESQRFTGDDNKESGRFMIGPYSGDVHLSINTASPPNIQIHQVYANPINKVALELGFGASYTCHYNVNCDEGKDFADEKRSVMRIRMVAEEGVGLCTGTLLNNTMGDRTPYVLTAYHCLVPPTGTFTPFYDMWWFDFGYEGFSCANPEEEPKVYFPQGATKLAEWEDTDMMLLLIEDEIPKEANVFYAGWNRDQEYLPDSTYLIHHPVGDIKKISFDFDPVLVHDRRIGWDNGGNSPELSHYKNEFDGTTYQPGSSGAAIFDTDGHVFGQLHGGPLSDEFCTIGIGYSGRLSESWDVGDSKEDRLSDWLDPLGTGALEIGGLNEKSSEFVRISGRLLTPDDVPIPDVRVSLQGDKNASFATGNDGGFVFENLDPDGTYEISFNKNTNAVNGLSASDLVIFRNHIIGRKVIQDQFSLLAADVSNDGSISSADLVQVRNLIFGRKTEFAKSPSWDFDPAILRMDGTNMTTGTMDVIITGYKMGDLNNTADPTK